MAWTLPQKWHCRNQGTSSVWSPRRSTTAGCRHPRAGVADKAEVTPGPAPCSTLPRLLALLTSRTAGLLNLADVSRTARIPYATPQRHHLALLERTFLVQQIDAWATNLGARLLKAAKPFLVDSGLAATRAP
jgi:predicted AAA+ superfamily ATPase